MNRSPTEKIIGIYALEQAGHGELRVELRDTATNITRWEFIDQGVGEKALEDLVVKAEKLRGTRLEREAREAERQAAELERQRAAQQAGHQDGDEAP